MSYSKQPFKFSEESLIKTKNNTDENTSELIKKICNKTSFENDTKIKTNKLIYSSIDTETNPLIEQSVTPKMVKLSPVDERRWASVVKAKKKLILPTETSIFEDQSDTNITSDMFRHIISGLPDRFENHIGFISYANGLFVCNVCLTELESILSLSNHLNTRKHEDNVITFFKEKLPLTLHYILEFVSFFSSNLCCNLCQCKIELSSLNPYETIVNIISHNTTTDHSNRKSHQETENDAVNLLRSLALIYPEIKEHVCFIEKKMSPQFRCELCDTSISYNENLNILAQNFLLHLKSTNHIGNQRAVQILKQFAEINDSGAKLFIVVSNGITCIYCNEFVEADLEKLIAHSNSPEHMKHNIGHNSTQKDNVINEVNSIQNEQRPIQQSEKKCKVRIADLLKSLTDLGETNYLIENETGGVTCVLCNKIVPANVHNIRTHLVGVNHSKNKLNNPEEELLDNDKSSSTATNSPSPCNVNLGSQSNTFNKEVNLKNWQIKFDDCLDCSGKKNTGKVTCLVCQYELSPIFTNVQKHFSSIDHQIKELNCLLKCPGCSRKRNHKKRSGASKCFQRQILSPLTQDKLCKSLLRRNSLVEENKQYLENNVDGMHVYCKICKALILISKDLDVFEKNMLKHLEGKVHLSNLNITNDSLITSEDFSSKIQGATELLYSLQTKNINEAIKREKVLHVGEKIGIKKVSNSLIEKITPMKEVATFCDYLKQGISNTEANEKSNASPAADSELKSSLLLSVDWIQPTLPEHLGQNGISNHVASDGTCAPVPIVPLSSKIDKNGDINSNKGSVCKDITKSIRKSKIVKAFPFKKPVCLMTFKEETNECVIKRREKQIAYGKNTEGYSRYLKKVPKSKRTMYQPETPPKYLKCSRRTWDGMVKVWRKQLHAWDPPNWSSESLAIDIKPLPLEPQ